jgi:hypothetical protein
MELSIYYKNIQWPKFQVVVIDMLITNRRLNYLIDGKDKPTFHTTYHVTAITFLIIGIIITTTVLFYSNSVLTRRTILPCL